MIIVLLSQTCSALSDREQQSFLRENNNYVSERRTIIIYERGEQQLCLKDMIVVLLSQT
jgi:hypothetical protein